MRFLGSLVAVSLLASGGRFAAAADRPPSALPRSSPEAQGVSSGAILSFIEGAEEHIDALHSFMLLRRGHVVAEGYWAPYGAASRHSLYSLTKSFTSTAVGMAVAEGRMSVDDPVLRYFPDDAPAEPGDNLKAMRVRDLLTMSTGQHKEAPFGPDQSWTKSFLAHPVDHKPGTFFLYNTPASNTLSAIVHKAVGAPLAEYLRPRLFEPLGVESPVWMTNPEGASIGGFGLSVRTEDIARFGQLYLQRGDWKGQRLLPADWVAAATARQVSNGSKPESDWEQGYGYQFWRCRHGAYRGDGAFGQFCIVMPEQDSVVAITSGVKDMQAVMNLVWERLLPALQAKDAPADVAARERLERKLAGLRLRPPTGEAAPPKGSAASGRKYVFPANEQKLEAMALERERGQPDRLMVRFGGVEQRIEVGRGEWRKGRLAYGSLPEQAVAASGAWTPEGVYTAKLYFFETPFALSLDLRFSGKELVYDSEFNVAFGPTKQPQLVGRAE